MNCSTPFPVPPRVCSDLCPLSQWCCLNVSSSAALFFCLQYFPASGSFPMSQLFASGSRSTGASASASVLPMIIEGWIPLGLIHLISLQSKGISRVFDSTIQKHKFFGTPASLLSNSYIHIWLLEKPSFWLYRPLSAKRCLCF